VPDERWAAAVGFDIDAPLELASNLVAHAAELAHRLSYLTRYLRQLAGTNYDQRQTENQEKLERPHSQKVHGF